MPFLKLMVEWFERGIVGTDNDGHLDEIIRVNLLNDILVRDPECRSDAACGGKIADAVDDKGLLHGCDLIILHFDDIKTGGAEEPGKACRDPAGAAAVEDIQLDDMLHLCGCLFLVLRRARTSGDITIADIDRGNCSDDYAAIENDLQGIRTLT